MVVAASPFGKVKNSLALLLAASPTWQQICGVTTQDEALKRVFTYQWNVTAEGYPAAIVDDPADFVSTASSVSGRRYEGALNLAIFLEFPDEADNIEEQAEIYGELMGLVQAEMSDLILRRVEQFPGAGVSHIQGDFSVTVPVDQEIPDEDDPGDPERGEKLPPRFQMMWLFRWKT